LINWKVAGRMFRGETKKEECNLANEKRSLKGGPSRLGSTRQTV